MGDWEFYHKNKVALAVVESLLQEMDFKKTLAVNYDPHHIISQRRKMNKKRDFEHQVVEGLIERVNWMDYPSSMKNTEVSQENPLAVIKATEVVTPIARNS